MRTERWQRHGLFGAHQLHYPIVLLAQRGSKRPHHCTLIAATRANLARSMASPLSATVGTLPEALQRLKSGPRPHFVIFKSERAAAESPLSPGKRRALTLPGPCRAPQVTGALTVCGRRRRCAPRWPARAVPC